MMQGRESGKDLSSYDITFLSPRILLYHRPFASLGTFCITGRHTSIRAIPFVGLWTARMAPRVNPQTCCVVRIRLHHWGLLALRKLDVDREGGGADAEILVSIEGVRRCRLVSSRELA
jgi:hypothetical protein